MAEKKKKAGLDRPSMIGPGDFPHGALTPFDATPRITPENAAKVCDLVDRARELGVANNIGPRPAIVIAIWQGALVKYLVDDQQAEETIVNLERKIAEKEAANVSANFKVAPSPDS